MQGKNELTLCEAELLVAVQEYLHKRLGSYTPKAVNISNKNYAYTITLEGLWGVVQDYTAAQPKGLPYACAVCGITGVGGVVCTNPRCPTKVTAT